MTRHRVSERDIEEMAVIYYETHSYAETARRTGWSPATVSKYIKPFVVAGTLKKYVKKLRK